MPSNCSLNVTDGVMLFQHVTSGFTIFFGLLGNILVLIVFCRRPCRDWTYMNVYITNLVVADILSIIFLPIRIMLNLAGMNIELCYKLFILNYINMYISMFTVTVISVVRYIAIKYPLYARKVFSCRRARVVCMLIWLITIFISFLTLYLVYKSKNNAIHCFQKNKQLALPSVVVLLYTLSFLLSFLIMSFCTARVILTLRKQLDVGSRSEKIQFMLIIRANLAVFVVCFLPVHVSLILKYVMQTLELSCVEQDRAHNIFHVAMSISNMNCALDCFSYYFATKSSWTFCCAANTATEETRSYRTVQDSDTGFSTGPT